MYKAEFVKSFLKDMKKLSPEIQRLVLDKWIKKICEDPESGLLFKGPELRGLRRTKFRFKRCDYRLVYKQEKDRLVVLFLAVGGRENFYRKLAL